MTTTVGQYLKDILERRKISFSELANKLGLKSRSTLYRLFNDNCSVARTREIIESINKYVDFSEDELDTIERLMGDDSVNSFYKKTRAVLKSLCSSKLKTGYVIREDYCTKLTLKQVLDKYSSYQTDVFMYEVDCEDIIGDLHEWLKNNCKSKLHCYYRFKYHRLQTAYELLSVIVLSRHHNFYPYVSDCMMYKGIRILSKNNDKYYLVSIHIEDGDNYYLETELTKEHYEYILNSYTRIEEKSGGLRKSVSKVSEYIEYCECLLDNEYGDIYHIEGAPCFGNLSFDILYEMFEKINFFGFPKEHIYVQKLIGMLKYRYESLFEKENLRKIFVFDEQHLKHMMQTGISFDHIEEFEPMTEEQKNRYFNGLYEFMYSESDRLKLKFYKGERIYFPYVYRKGGMLSLYCSSTGISDNYSIILTNNGVIDIMDDFIEYVWDEYTIPETSSLNKFKSMIDEYL